MIKCAKGGISSNPDELEVRYLADGNIGNVIDGLIYARANDKKVSFQEAARLDFSRKDVVKAMGKN